MSPSLRPPVIPGVTAEPKLRHSARSRGIHLPLPTHQPENPAPSALHHGYCDFAQYDGVGRATVSPSLRPPVIPGVTAEPKLRHSAHSRGIHLPLPTHQPENPAPSALHHGYRDFAQYDGVGRATVSPSLRPPVIPGVTAEPKLRHSARSRGIHLPLPTHQPENPAPSALHHGYRDFAQYDGVGRATVSPSLRPPVIPGVAAEPKLRHSAHSRGIHLPLPTHQPENPEPSALHHGYRDFAQYDGVGRATVSPSLRPPVIPGVTAEPKLRHSAHSRGIHLPLPTHQPENPAPSALHHGYRDFAQYDGVGRATVSPSLRPPVIPGVTAEPKLRHSVRSRGIHLPLPTHQPENPAPSALHHGYCDFAQYDGVGRATVSPSLRPPVIPGVTAEPKLRHSVRSRGIHASLSKATSRHSHSHPSPAWMLRLRAA